MLHVILHVLFDGYLPCLCYMFYPLYAATRWFSKSIALQNRNSIPLYLQFGFAICVDRSWIQACLNVLNMIKFTMNIKSCNT